jgi:hypothetical protein
MVLMVGLACTLGTASTPQPTPVILATSMPEATVLPPTSTPNRFFKENFDGNVDNWLPFATQGKLNQATLSVQNGFYVFDLPQQNVSVYSIYEPETYKNTRIDVTIENRGYNKNNVSIVCRYNEKLGWYEASISNNGLFRIYYAKWDKKHVIASYQLIYSGGSNNIHQGQETNTYTFICRENTLLLGINGTLVEELTENEFGLTEGNIGIGVSSFNIIPIKVAFDTVEVSEP